LGKGIFAVSVSTFSSTFVLLSGEAQLKFELPTSSNKKVKQ